MHIRIYIYIYVYIYIYMCVCVSSRIRILFIHITAKYGNRTTECALVGSGNERNGGGNATRATTIAKLGSASQKTNATTAAAFDKFNDSNSLPLSSMLGLIRADESQQKEWLKEETGQIINVVEGKYKAISKERTLHKHTYGLLVHALA